MAEGEANGAFVKFAQPRGFIPQTACPTCHTWKSKIRNLPVPPEHSSLATPDLSRIYVLQPVKDQQSQRFHSLDNDTENRVLQMDNNCDNFISNAAQARIISGQQQFVTAGPVTSVNMDCVEQFKDNKCFQSTTVRWVPSGSSYVAKTEVHAPILLPHRSSRIAHRRENLHPDQVQYSKMQWLYIILSWLIAASGLAAYLYILTLAFTGQTYIFSRSYTFLFITIVSNVSLLSAVYFHCKIRKYLLL